jgi:hypothetical protein
VSGLLVILGISAALIAAVLAAPWVRRRRRDRLHHEAFPVSWEAILTRNLPAYRRLSPDLREQLQQAMRVFLAEKVFIGCDGLGVTEEMRVSIAAQACLLVARLGIDRYDHVQSILLYPDTFIARHEDRDEAGVHTVEEKELGGESWPEGKVVLSWRDVCDGLAEGAEAYNVVYHEFAHQLDQADGEANGVPLLDDAARYRRWSAVFAQEYERLHEALDAEKDTLLPVDAAESPGEFFAIATEVFMDKPRALRALHPVLYGELRSYYRIDPGEWS